MSGLFDSPFTINAMHAGGAHCFGTGPKSAHYYPPRISSQNRGEALCMALSFAACGDCYQTFCRIKRRRAMKLDRQPKQGELVHVASVAERQ